MLTIRGICDGKTYTPLPTEILPKVRHEIPVAIIFLEDGALSANSPQIQQEIAQRMKAAREAMPPLEIDIKELIEEGQAIPRNPARRTFLC